MSPKNLITLKTAKQDEFSKKKRTIPDGLQFRILLNDISSIAMRMVRVPIFMYYVGAQPLEIVNTVENIVLMALWAYSSSESCCVKLILVILEVMIAMYDPFYKQNFKKTKPKLEHLTALTTYFSICPTNIRDQSINEGLRDALFSLRFRKSTYDVEHGSILQSYSIVSEGAHTMSLR